jgi:hypothetical protein
VNALAVLAAGILGATATPTPTPIPTPTPTGSPAPATPAARLAAADALHLQGDLAGAAAAYEALRAEGLGGAALHANLGTTRWLLGERGRALAAWLRAERAAPNDVAVRANLALARTARVDRLDGDEGRGLLARLAVRTPDPAAVAAFLMPWTALWLALALRPRAAPRALAAAAVLCAVGAAAGGTLLATRAAEVEASRAVVVAPSAPARPGPERALRPAFELHEGAEVRVLEARGDAVRVRLPNGLEGWLDASAVERV